MENKYFKMKQKHQKEVNAFPMAFAFSDEQFVEAMKKLGLNPTDTDKIYKLGGTGGIYRRTDSKALHDMFNNHEKEMKDAMDNDDEFLLQMFSYELANHEYIISRDVSDTLDALGLNYEEIKNNERYKNALQQAIKEQFQFDEDN